MKQLCFFADFNSNFLEAGFYFSQKLLAIPRRRNCSSWLGGMLISCQDAQVKTK